jgi:hypothetical protein
MAKVYGDGVFGISSESGVAMYGNDFSFELTSETAEMPGEGGDDVGLAVFNEAGTWSLSGFQRSTGTIGGELGAAITVANAESDISGWVTGVSASGEKTILTSVKMGKQHRGFATADISGVVKPYVDALQV